MTENTNPAAFYPHDHKLPGLTPDDYRRTRIAIEANRDRPLTVVGFRPEEIEP